MIVVKYFYFFILCRCIDILTTMGIKDLMTLIKNKAPESIEPLTSLEQCIGKRIAVDASMCLYQFLIQVRAGKEAGHLINADGQVTSHLTGLLYRVICWEKCGLLPVFVFDGKAPEMKRRELEKRNKIRHEAEEALKQAKESGNEIEIAKYAGRTTRVTQENTKEAIDLLRLMGVPVVQAPGEAEAQCAWMCREGLVDLVASEDMDTLTFGTPKLIRGLAQARNSDLEKFKSYCPKNGKKSTNPNPPVSKFKLTPTKSNTSKASDAKATPDKDSKPKKKKEFGLSVIHSRSLLSHLKLSMSDFINLCVLSGCDYVDRIKKIGSVTAFNYIVKQSNNNNESETFDSTNDETVDSLIQAIVEDNKFPEDLDPTDYLTSFKQARQLFVNPLVDKTIQATQLKLGRIDEKGILDYLVTKRQFKEKRVLTAIENLKKARASLGQTSMSNFFKDRKDRQDLKDVKDVKDHKDHKDRKDRKDLKDHKTIDDKTTTKFTKFSTIFTIKKIQKNPTLESRESEFAEPQESREITKKRKGSFLDTLFSSSKKQKQ